MTSFLETESAVLGLCLIRPGALATAVTSGISAEVFSDPDHRRIFLAMLDAEREDRQYDYENLVRRIPDLSAKLWDVQEAVPFSLDLEPFVQDLLDVHWQRRASDVLKGLLAIVADRKQFHATDPIKARIVSAIDQLTSGQDKNGPKRIDQALNELLPEIEKQVIDRKSGKPSGIPTGFAVLDQVTGGGFGPSTINVAAARTGRGKTTLAVNFLHTAAMAGYGCAYFTVEMPTGEILRKLLSLSANVNGTRLRIGDLGSGDMDRLMEAQRKLYGRPIWFDDSTGANFEAFEFACRKLKRQGQLDLVVIDYIQQFHLPGRWNTTNDRLTAVSHRLKQLALNLKVAVVALAQLNREAEKGDVQPDTYHIKDCGAIEQDSDLIVLIHANPDGTSLYVGKNRHGKDRFAFPVESNLAFNAFREVNLNLEAFGE